MEPSLLLLILILMVVSASVWVGGGRDNSGRLRCIERKVDLILDHLGLDPNQGVNQEVLELMKAGQKIQAIKLYREQTGAGLKESKDYVEGLSL
jgi:Ribosomal protein L7/L12 C-terminal domain